MLRDLWFLWAAAGVVTLGTLAYTVLLWMRQTRLEQLVARLERELE
ncbi:hypothetical protein GCM10010885_01720 [Alicyclobacillus cellulosilyticus]|uniref:CcmD family protein n=1 Tax=Alicyclobacillus cellulosilyticus TaxID=1003997 RepID=A0A917NEN1_9BACL|nr:hypothetical protein [Alicyclobacillus cellulosilyticus]GGI95698.1 hypothetical protein GCM10010885_01720 [Alicyclobacillus cellulosilyticus]